MIALDRYRGILWPLKGGYSKFRAKIHLMIVWFLATVVALPNLILFHVSQDLVSFRPALAATCHAWPLPLITLSKLEGGKVAGRWGFSWFCTSEKMYLWSLSFSLSLLKGFRVAFWWLFLDFFSAGWPSPRRRKVWLHRWHGNCWRWKDLEKLYFGGGICAILRPSLRHYILSLPYG